MTYLRLLLRNLLYFRAASLAVIAGMVVSTAVLAGSLMVGDSVRGSLRALAIQRLGPVDYALVANRFFDDSAKNSFAARLTAESGIEARFQVTPALVANGGATAGSGDSKTRTGDVQILAFGGEWAKVAEKDGLVNRETYAALNSPAVSADKPMPITFTFPSKEDAPREAPIARRNVEETSATLSANLVRLVGQAPNREMLELFNLQGGQRTPRNAWVNLKALQEAIGQPGRANVLLVRDNQVDYSVGSGRDEAAASEAVARLNAAVKSAVRLTDYGLQFGTSKSTGETVLSTPATYLDPPIVKAAEEAAKRLNFEPRLATVNLVNRVAVTDAKGESDEDGPALHYVIAAGVSRLDDGPFGPNDIAFNEETAKQLGVKLGDHIRLDYYRRNADGELAEITSQQKGIVFTVTRILPMRGIAADVSLTPTFKGLTDADAVSDWRPPKELRIDEKLAEKDNDAYWKKYKAAPRLLIHIDAARKLWAGPYGEITSIRVPAEKAEAFKSLLQSSIDPASLGFVFQPVKLQQLAASSGSTDFSGLFVGFSFFLIAAAALLVAMLFRLNIEQRVRQFGVLSAVGFTPKRLRWMALAEGAILSLIGGAIGVAVGVGYTWLMVYGLKTWWVDAIGTTALDLYVYPRTLWAGFIFGFWVALGAVLWAVWRLGKVSPVRLMAGQLSADVIGLKKGDGRRSRFIGIAIGVAGLVLLLLVLVRVIREPEMALGGGALLLTAGLFYLAGLLRPRRHLAGQGDVRTVVALGLRNARRHTGRSVLSIGLIAFAAFTLITVASMQKSGAGDTGDIQSGSGGYRLIAQPAVPVLADLNTRTGRYQAGFQKPDDAVWTGVKFMQLRRWAGQDISCLNLTQATSPTILGVPASMTARHGFTQGKENPWTLIEPEVAEDKPVPVLADDETATYILKLGVGETLSITDQLGRKRDLLLVATLPHCVFQSELLMGEANFRKLFPAQGGFGTLLVECPAEKVPAVQQAINTELEPYAVSVDTTAARLEGYQKIQNTYLSTFRTLGSLGLALGTIGLAVVLIRNVIERRGELALLGAIGFVSSDRVKLVLSENILLLVLGLGVGTGCALLGIVPTLLTSGGGVAWGQLGLTLLGVLVLGLLASVLAVRVSGMKASPRDLRSE